MAEVITAPAPLVGYNPPWEEPGQVKLEDVGQELVNAHALGVGLNIRRQQVQQQLAELGIQQRRLELQDKWQADDLRQKYYSTNLLDKYHTATIRQDEEKIKNADRQLDLMEDYHDEDIKLRRDKLDWEVKSKTADVTGATSLTRDLANNPYPTGSDEAMLYVNKLRRDYAPVVASNDDAFKIIDEEQRRQESARTATRQATDDQFNKFMKVSPMDPDDLSQPDTAFGDTKLADGTPAKYRAWIGPGRAPPTKAYPKGYAWAGKYITPKDEEYLTEQATHGSDQEKTVAQAMLNARDFKTWSKNDFDFYRSHWQDVKKGLQNRPADTAAPGDKRSRAIQILKQNNKVVTEATIQAVMNQL
jgi:hypothetical protein